MPRTITRILVEFAIIFAGVTLGLLADDWRQDRMDRATERLALEDLSEDLLRDSVQLEQVRLVAQGWDQAALWARRADPRSVTAEQAADHMAAASSMTIYQPVTSSYSSLKDSGQLDLIRDAELRRQIVGYFEQRQPSMVGMYEIAQEQFLEFQAALWPYFVQSVADSATSLFPGNGLEPRDSWIGFWDDEHARQSLDQIGQSASIWIYLIPGVLQSNSELRREVAAKLR